MSIAAVKWALTTAKRKSLVLVALAEYADDGGTCWPSTASLAARAGIKPRGVRKELAHLERLGLIVRARRRHRSSVFRIILNGTPGQVSTALQDTQNPPLESTKERKIMFQHLGKREKPLHGSTTKDGQRIWLDRGTTEYDAYDADYRVAHMGQPAPLCWNDSGAWFNYLGMQRFQ